MKLFKKKRRAPSGSEAAAGVASAARGSLPPASLPPTVFPSEKALYDRLRAAVPIVDAALMKIIRLTGGFRAVCSDEELQPELDRFFADVPVGLSGRSVGSFIDNFLDSLLTYGSAIGEIASDGAEGRITGLYNGDVSRVRIVPGSGPFSREYLVRRPDGSEKRVSRPDRILYASLTGGKSLLRGLPVLSGILLRIYECIGQNYDRAGNVRYAVTYKPPAGSGDIVNSRERARQIAEQWADGVSSSRGGTVKDFVAVGDVDIKVIGAENQLFDTNVPVRQILEQLVAKLSIPPFLLGLSWSSTERMSSQQADILTSELEYYRRLLSPVIREIGDSFLASMGSEAVCRVEWDNINLQDESVLAEARLNNARAREIELRLESAENAIEIED